MRSLPHKPSRSRTRNVESRRWKATRRRLPRKSAGFSVIRRRLPPNNPSPLRRPSLPPPPNDPNLSLPHKQPRTRNVGSRRWKATRRRLPRKSAGFSVIRRGLPPNNLPPPEQATSTRSPQLASPAERTEPQAATGAERRVAELESEKLALAAEASK